MGEVKKTEDQQVDGQLDAAKEHAEKCAEVLVDDAVDSIDDRLLPPFDLLVMCIHRLIPTFVAKMIKTCSSVLMNMPFSGFFHTLSIDLLPLYVFYYSVQKTLKDILIAGATELTTRTNTEWANPRQTDPCVTQAADTIIWSMDLKNASDPGKCFHKAYFNQTLKDPGLDEVGQNRLKYFAYMNVLCCLLCFWLWLIVMLNFLLRNKWWVRMQDGSYLKNALLAKRSRFYRYTSGLISIGMFLGVIAVAYVCHMFNIVGQMFRHVVPPVIAIFISGKAIILPTKPKFDYLALDGVRASRPTFFQTNGSFMTTFGNALMQAARDPRYSKSLRSLLYQPETWPEVLSKCLNVKHTPTSTAIAV